MEFGKINTDELATADLSLPRDFPGNHDILKKSTGPASLYVGCAKWGRKDWLGRIYPKGTKEADFLSHYARHFNSIELNATFYKMPTRLQATAWSSKVGDNFRFCPKVSNKISHIKRLKDVASLTERFVEGISGFGKNLGPVLLMVHPGMGAKHEDTIAAFLESFPKNIAIFVELRHEDWFKADTQHNIFTILEKYGAGAAITDVAGRRDCLHMRFTTPSTFIRFNGNDMHPSDYTRVDEWVERIAAWIRAGIREIYFFMHQENEIYSPELARYFIMKMNPHCGNTLPVPTFVSEK